MTTGGQSDHHPGQSGSDPGSHRRGLHPHASDHRSIAAYLRERCPGLERFFEKYLSLRSIRWRFEARATGTLFAEIALARSSLYSVEQVFLMDRDSGLLLQHVAARAATVRDPDLVGGMFNAIQMRVEETFGRHERLETVRVGDFQMWIQPGPKAELLAVISGCAPIELKKVFEDVVDRIHTELAHELDTFPVVGARIDAARPYLQACLLGRGRRH